jgi:SAM-dependent methyltransferase
MSFSAIRQALASHYASTFEKYGACPEGVDWGPHAEDHHLRLDLMIDVTRQGLAGMGKPSLLDVGCGFGSLLDRATARGIELEYAGVDVCQPMVELARERHPDAKWIVADVLTGEMPHCYDFVVCNGILTQKLGASNREMDEFLKALVRRMFSLCKVGIAFNVMSTHVNFMVPNLYYRSPAELLAWCMSEITPKAMLHSAYPLFEFTVYLYREDAAGLQYGDHRKGGL